MLADSQKLYTQEINAAVRGAKAAGATEIVVMDCHGAGGGWTFNSLARRGPGSRLRVGRAGRDGPAGAGFLEDGCDAALFVGMHAMAGDPSSATSTTPSPAATTSGCGSTASRWGRAPSTPALCGTWGCPVVLVTGDQAACDEGRAPLGAGLDDGRRQAGARLAVGADDPAGARPRADRRRCAPRAVGSRCRRALRPRQPVRDQGRVQADRARRPAALSLGRSSGSTAARSACRRTAGGTDGTLLSSTADARAVADGPQPMIWIGVPIGMSRQSRLMFTLRTRTHRATGAPG